jgi:hypothetical protein
LVLLSFNKSADKNILQSLAAMSRLDQVRAIEPPETDCFTEFELDIVPSREYFQALIAADYPEPVLPRMKQAQLEQARASHKLRCDDEGKCLSEYLIKQWPNRKLTIHGFESSILDLKNTLERIQPHWNRFCDNLELSDYLIVVQRALSLHQGPQDSSSKSKVATRPSCSPPDARKWSLPSSCKDLLLRAMPNLEDYQVLLEHRELPFAVPPQDKLSSSLPDPEPEPSGVPEAREYKELDMILDRLSSDADNTRVEYATDLRRSLTSLRGTPALESSGVDYPTLQTTRQRMDYMIQTGEAYNNIAHDAINRSYGIPVFKWLHYGEMWPCITRMTLLEQVRSSSNCNMEEYTRLFLIHAGTYLAVVQQLKRMEMAILLKDQRRLLEELQNPGHSNWNPADFPDCLLLELENDIMIRAEQFQVARAIISPQSGSNSVLQMNMGKVSYMANLQAFAPRR